MGQGKGKFSKEELERYSRHLLLPEFGRAGQERLKNSKVLVLGAGALGAPVIYYLAAAGVGHIRIVDPDTVADHNLQRQILFTTEDIGREKAVVAKERAEALNPWIEVEAVTERMDSENAMRFLDGMDLLLDGSDNFPTRYLANDASVLAGIPNVHASIFRFEGQIAVFGGKGENGKRNPDYRDLFPEPPPPGSVPGCNEGGVMGVLPGVMGSLQANECIKILTGMGEPLKGELLLFDALKTETRRVKIPKDPDRPKIEHLIDYEAFCGLSPSSEGVEDEKVESIAPETLKKMREEGERFRLIDVREEGEREIVNIGGERIPMERIPEALKEASGTEPIVLYCRSGKRSERAAQRSKRALPDREVWNLEGGILAWIERIDPELPSY